MPSRRIKDVYSTSSPRLMFSGNISALSSASISKYEFLASGDVLSEKGLLKKAATIKRFQYSPLNSELKKQTDIVGKQYWGSSKVYEFDKKEGNDETIIKKRWW